MKRMEQKDYEELLTDIVKDIIEGYYKFRLDKYTLTIIGQDILYMYALVRLKYSSDKALEYSIKYFNEMLEEYKPKE